jgi:hypothetical protein
MNLLRLLGLGICPPLLCYFATLGVIYHLRFLSGFGASIGRKPLVIVSVLVAGTLTLLMLWAFRLQIRSRTHR